MVRYGRRKSHSASETSLGYDFRVVFMPQHEQSSHNKSITGSRPNCLRLFEHCARRADSRTDWTAGSSMPDNSPMIEITTRSSTKVKADVGAVPVRRFKSGFPP